jgi:hypothetical protein
MKRFSLRYTLMTSRFDQLWFPLAFWLLFVIVGTLRGTEYILDTSRAYLGAVVPLVSGIMAAYALLEDPVLELRFATPISARQTLAERLLPTFLVEAFLALTFQLFALVFMQADFSVVFMSGVNLQLAWLIPTLALMTLGSFTALAGTNSSTGALLVGMVWIVELVARGWFAHNRIGQYFLIFMSSLMLDHPNLRANKISLMILSFSFIIAAWILLRRQERYI